MPDKMQRIFLVFFLCFLKRKARTMNKIITISREFGSGGRELGKRLAESLGIAYYDREIIIAIAEKSGLAESYVESVTEKGVTAYYPITYNRTFSYQSALMKEQVTVMLEQRNIIHEIAEKSDCVIVGRCADIILQELSPLRFFIYADMESKIDRCIEREEDSKKLSRNEMKKQILQVDKDRARAYSMLSDFKWGDKAGYDVCLNTSRLDIKTLVPALVQLREFYFDGDK